MDNLKIYNAVAAVPREAQKKIGAGRLKGMTDINPMWRIKALTELFGICGIGWKYVITDKRIVDGADGVVCAFVDIDLFVKVEGEWSDAIPGTGGSQLVQLEKAKDGTNNKVKYTNDECFKMALTDAISVACKALGFGADVYWASGRTKYSGNGESEFPVIQAMPTYEEALEIEHNGKKLREIYHEDRKAIQVIYEAAETPEAVKNAIGVIEFELSRKRAAQNAGA